MTDYVKTPYEVPDTFDALGVLQPTITVAKANHGEEGIRLAQAAADAAQVDAGTALAHIPAIDIRAHLPAGVPTGTDDTSYFASAFAAAGEGGTVYAPRFTTPYVLNSVPFTNEGQTLRGDGMGLTYGTRFKAKAAATQVLRIEGLRYCSIRDCVIDGNNRASRGLLYQGTASLSSQNLMMERVMFYRCTRGWHIGLGTVDQTDKNTLINCEFIECDYGIYVEAVNSQETILVNCDFGTTYRSSIYLLAGCITMIGGQFQGSGAVGTATTTNASANLTLVAPTNAFQNGMGITGTGIPAGTTIVSGGGTATLVMSAAATASAAGVAITGGTKGIEFAGYNIGWVALKDVIFEGPRTDIADNAAMWPQDGVIAENVVFQGPISNVLVNTINARFTARHCRFNNTFSPPTLGNGYISWNQAGGVFVDQACDYGPPVVTGAVLPFRRKAVAWATTVASAATISPAPGADVVTVTGTTTITSMTAQPDGHRVTLRFTGACTLTNGSNLKLQGNFVAVAGDAITLVSDGVNWAEC